MTGQITIASWKDFMGSIAGKVVALGITLLQKFVLKVYLSLCGFRSYTYALRDILVWCGFGSYTHFCPSWPWKSF